MTVPYLSAPAWAARKRRGFPLQRQLRGVFAAPPTRAAHLGSLIRYGLRRIAWIDIAIQLVAATAVLALASAMVTGGAFQRAVDSFTDWYLGAVAPTFATGVAVIPVDFRDGFFGEAAEVPAALQRPGPGYTLVAEISGVVEAAGR